MTKQIEKYMPLKLRKKFTAILKPFFLAISTDQLPRHETMS